MKILLDTHFLIWLITAPKKIERRELALIGRSDIFVSLVSIWELRTKWRKFEGDKRRGRELLDATVALKYVADNNYVLAMLTAEDCVASLSPSVRHGDPFDEMLLIHARRLGARLLTRDGDLADHPLVVQL